MAEAQTLNQENPFKWRQYEPEIILLCVRWYLSYSLSYRDLEEIMVERGLQGDHTTIYRWVQHSAPELEQRVRAPLKPTNDSWRVDETYSNVHGSWMDRYRALDSVGNTLEFMFSPPRHAGAAACFFRKALGQAHTVMPRVVNVDQNAAYPPAIAALQAEGTLDPAGKLRPVKYLNNIVEQDHRFIKRRVRPGLGFWSCLTAWRTSAGYEAMNQLRKGQVQGTTKGDIVSQVRFIDRAFGLAA
jgi:transposase-like protein